jgi:1-acyl-sn-glycerol-3-phosphate acyltransferase
MVLMVANVLAWCVLLFVVALLKLLVPVQAWRRRMSRVMVALAENWISCNHLIFRVMGSWTLQVSGTANLDRNEWYLVIANHRSWVDILVLQSVFNRRIPFLKFFLKKELIRVPVLGLAWWALDFPFMQRHSSAYLAKHPEARGQDIEATRKACEKFREIPTSVMNFVEGTRWTPAKHAATRSPYNHLLAPRAGGTSFALSAMGGVLSSLLDVTIVYDQPNPSLWDLCCGRVGRIRVAVRKLPIEAWMSQGDYSNDQPYRERFQTWLNGLWKEKDALLSSRLE